MKSYLLFSNCSRMASFINRSPSFFETGLATAFSDFHTCSLSSLVLACAKGLRFFAFLSIPQIYCNSITRHNRNVLFPLHQRLSPEEFCVLDFQYLKQSVRSFFWNYIRKQWYKNLSEDSLPAWKACAWDCPIQKVFQIELSCPDSHHSFHLTLKNLYPYLPGFYINKGPEELFFLREIQDGAIKLFLKSKALFFNTLNGFHSKVVKNYLKIKEL